MNAAASRFPKHCTCCGRSYAASEWSRLPYVGLQADGFGGHLELRNCSCGSTIAVHVVPTGEPTIGTCYRCTRCEELRTFRGIQVCLECAVLLQDEAENTIAGVMAHLERRKAKMQGGAEPER